MLSFEKARQGFKFHCQVANRSAETVQWYDANLAVFGKFLASRYPECDAEHLCLESISQEDVQFFISALQNKDVLFESHNRRKPVKGKLSAYTVHGYSRTLSAFFHWACKQKYIESNPMENVPRPKLPKTIKPRYSESDIKKLLSVCAANKPLPVRNRAIILVLLDSGIRANELCTLTLDRVDEQLRRIHVTGKGLKDRMVPLGAKTRQALWEYIHVHRPAARETNAVFLSQNGRPLHVIGLDRILRTMGRRAGVPDVHAHKFRHSCARMFLKNGGNVLTLQQLLGHETLEMVSIYARQEQEDLDRTHERASPVDRLGL